MQTVHAQILRAAEHERFAVLTHCYMPDHAHLLVEGIASDADGRCFIARARQMSAYHFHREFGTRLWQRYGYEHTLRNDESAISVARYIVENPVRAGLVERVEDYPFSGSSLYTIREILEAVQWTHRRSR